VNLCWDVINYHFYSNNGVSGGVATTGVAPELSGTMKTAQAFIKMSHLYAHNMPVWVTESGYDVNSGSPQRAPAIGSKTALQVEADWILRTSMLYARAGIARLFFYEAYDDSPTIPIQYGSSGLLNSDFSRRPAANYLYELNKQFGNYLYKQSLSTNPIVDQYQDSAKVMYALAIPDQVGRTANYTLNLGTADSAIIYNPTITGNVMSSTAVKLSGGKLTVNVTETPTFVVPIGIASGVVPPSKPDSTGTDTTTVKTPAGGISLYPNPTAKYVTVAFSNNNFNPVTIKITDVGMGSSYLVNTYPKPSNDFSETLDLGSIHRGVWLVLITQTGRKTLVKKLIKTSD